MPVVRISGLPQGAGVDLTRTLQRLCVELAQLDGVDARHWWATWQPIDPASYVEGDTPAPAEQPTSTHPPIVEVLGFRGRDPELVERLLAASVEIVADGLRVDPGNVFAFWTELAPGRVSTGGQIRW